MRLWLWWTLLAVLCWGLWALVARLIGDALSPGQQQSLSTLGLLPVMMALGFSGRLGPPGRGPRGILFALSAGVLTCLGNVAYYDVLNRGTKAATVVPLTALYPLVTIVLAVIFLRERINRIQSAGLLLSLGAIYLFNVQDDGALVSPWLLAALVPVGLWGVAALFQKLATQDLSGERATLWFLAAFLPVAALLLLGNPPTTGIGWRTWLLVLLMGFAFALGNLALLAAFARNGKASVITPLAGLYPLVSIPLAIGLLGEKVGHRETLGIAVALLAVFALACESAPTPSPESVPPLSP